MDHDIVGKTYEIALTEMSKVRMFKENEPFIEYNNLDREVHDIVGKFI